MGMFDRKLCRCSNDGYTRFLGCCGSLSRGMKVWCTIWMVLSLIMTFEAIFFDYYYIPIFSILANALGLAGVSKESRKGAKLLRGYCFCYIAAAISDSIYMVFIWVYALDVALDGGWVDWWTMSFISLYYAWLVTMMHMLISSAESLAKIKESTPLPQFIDTVGTNQFQSPDGAPQQPHVVYVQHQMDPGNDSRQTPEYDIHAPAAPVNLQKGNGQKVDLVKH